MNELVIKEEYLPDTIESLREFILIGQQKLKVYQAKVNAIDNLKLSQEVRFQAIKDGQDMGKALLYAEAKFGELIKPLTEHHEAHSGSGRSSLPEGISWKQSHIAQKIADNIPIIEEVIKDAEQYEDIPTKYEVLRRIKDKEKEERLLIERENRQQEITNIEIRSGDFKDVLSDVYEIDAIITDPPYPKEFIKCFSELSLFAKDHLKDKGWLVVYSGQYNLPEVINRLSEHMTYVWTFCLYHVGKKQLVNGVNIMCGWKPILIFSKGQKKMRFSAYDVIVSEQMEKHSHEWQQSESGINQLIEIFTVPGQLIIDPFSGSGTFLKSAMGLGRKCIGAEIDTTKI